MPTYIALLRGINVSGQKIIKMADLKAHFEKGGCTAVQTYIQSGNVVFQHSDEDIVALREHIEAHLNQCLGYFVPTLLRTHAEISDAAASNPYPTDWPEFGKKMYVCFFESAPSEAGIEAIRPYTNEDEKLEVRGMHGYAYYSVGLGKSKLTNSIIERKLGMATMRNWNTVNTLLDMSK